MILKRLFQNDIPKANGLPIDYDKNHINYQSLTSKLFS